MVKENRLHAVLSALFRPLARVMIANGVNISVATELLKMAFVASIERTAGSDAYLTDSRVSLLTGLHRKDVRRLRRCEPTSQKRSFAGGCALTIAFWTGDKRFLNSRGKPRSLATSPGSRVVTFDQLVRAAGLDVPAATVLQELERTGMVRLNHDRSNVSLLKRAYVAESAPAAKLEAFEKNLYAHLSAASGNLVDGDGASPFFERAAHFNNLSTRSVERVQVEAGRLFQRALETLNMEALAAQKRDYKDPGNRARISLGAYIFSREEPSTSHTELNEESAKG